MSDPNDPYAPPSGGTSQDPGTQPLPTSWSTGTPVDAPRRSAEVPAPPPVLPYAAPSPPADAPVAYPVQAYPPPPLPYGAPPYGQVPYGHVPYGSPGPYGGPFPVRRTNGLAVTSLVLGILWLSWAGSILALVFGYVALGQIRRAPVDAPQGGRGLAIAGIVLGWIGAGTLLLVVLVAGVLAPTGY